jgi:CRP/FNR family transcriptional regulator, anaerobic regulatory protein
VDVIAFRRTPFEALLLESPELERLVLLNLLNEVDRARDWLIILANPRIRGRLAGFLTVLCTRFAKIGQLLKVDEQTIEVRIPLSRVDLAHLLGTRPETISRAFHALADKGIIAIKRPDLIVVRDIDGLIAEAGEDGTDLKVSLRALLLATVRPKERGAARHRSSARGTGSPRP